MPERTPGQHSVTWRAFGLTVTVRGCADVVAVAGETAPPGYERVAAPANREWVLPDDRARVRAVMSEVELWVAEHSPERVFLHAGCVVVDGVAVVLPGRSGAGKTTLVGELLRRGAAFWSDEYAVLDANGAVWPYPRRLHVRPRAGAEPMPTEVSEFGGRVGIGPARVGLVAQLRYDPAGGWVVEALSQGAAGLAALDNCVGARPYPRRALRAVTAAVRGVPAIRGTRGSAADAADRLLEMLASGRLLL